MRPKAGAATLTNILSASDFFTLNLAKGIFFFLFLSQEVIFELCCWFFLYENVIIKMQKDCQFFEEQNTYFMFLLLPMSQKAFIAYPD